MIKVYFDTEFTGLHKNTTLISIGLVCDNKMFYAELTDYDKSQVDTWLQTNVISKLRLDQSKEQNNNDTTLVYGDKSRVRDKLLEWLSQFTRGGNYIQFVSDVCHYDFVLLIDLLFGEALNVPNNISRVCLDLNDKISSFLNLDPNQAFDYGREKLLDELELSGMNTNYKHNSLYDAIVIKLLYEYIERSKLAHIINPLINLF